MVAALNAHDALVAERDALAEALGVLVAKILELDAAYDSGFEDEMEAARAALALVHGEVSDG